MSVAYRSTCWPTIGQPLLVDISTDRSVKWQSTYQPMLDRYVGRYIDQHISVDIMTDTRPICRPKYWSTLGRYVDRYVGRQLVDMSTDMSVEGCTKHTWSFSFSFFNNTEENNLDRFDPTTKLSSLLKIFFPGGYVNWWPDTKQTGQLWGWICLPG